MKATEWDKVTNITPGEFRLWLQSKEPTELVGHPGLGDCCPVQNFISENTGHDLFVGAMELSIPWADEGHPYDTRPTPY